MDPKAVARREVESLILTTGAWLGLNQTTAAIHLARTRPDSGSEPI